jgi:hypothetical protein
MPNPSQDPEKARYPIIYVRGYAMTDGEKDETAADPFCGFNAGSTVYRAVSDRTKPAQRFVFESPVVRLMKDFGYSNVYENGLDILDDGYEGQIPPTSIIIYRYYDDTAPLLGGKQAPSLERFAKGLSDLILRLRDHVCANALNCMPPENFRCYLVAHSMGGLVCRAFLQNPDLGDGKARATVDKFFTYATPHNGIDMAGMNVPSWLSAWDMNTFNRDKLMGLFGYDEALRKRGRSDYLRNGQDFDARRCFCMVGSNRSDYHTAMGLSRTFAGHGSDGLVRIENACLCDIDRTGMETPVATAYTYRSHSGFFGIVNSEEAYQNLTRFLFGDVRVDIFARVDRVTLPPAIQGKDVDALYQFEVLASPRGKPWFLTRRVAEEDSVACRSHAELTGAPGDARRTVYLSSVFLANRSRVDKNRASLSYSITFGARVPDYKVDRILWLDQHYEGSYLYRDTLIVELLPPATPDDSWKVRYRWQSQAAAPIEDDYKPMPLVDGKAVLEVGFASASNPGIAGTLVFNVSAWNDWGGAPAPGRVVAMGHDG